MILLLGMNRFAGGKGFFWDWVYWWSCLIYKGLRFMETATGIGMIYGKVYSGERQLNGRTHYIDDLSSLNSLR